MYGLKDIANATGRTRQNILSLVKKGVIKAEKQGSIYIVEQEEYDRVLKLLCLNMHTLKNVVAILRKKNVCDVYYLIRTNQLKAVKSTTGQLFIEKDELKNYIKKRGKV